jgi:predicted MFS family arabinose efflux permease
MTESPRVAVTAALGGLLSLAAAMGIGRFVYTPILPYMAEGLGMTPADGGIVASANYLGYLVGALAASMRGFGGSRRAWFLAALGLSAVSTASMALGHSMALFVLLRFAGGVASAFVMVFASTLILERLASARRPGLYALHFAGVGTGIAVSAVLVAGADAAGFGWRTQWILGGIVSLCALAAAAVLVPPEARPAPSSDARPPVRAPLPPATRTLIVAYGLFGFGYVITATFVSTIVRMSDELRPVEPLVWLTVGVAGAPSIALWAWVGRRFGNATSFAVACLVEAVGVAATVLFDNVLAVLAGAALLGGTFIGITAVGLVLARDLGGGDPRRSIGLMTASFGLGQMIGPGFAGYAFRFGDSFLVPSLVAAFALIAAAALVPRDPAPVTAGPGGPT